MDKSIEIYLSVVIPNYNGFFLLKENLPFLKSALNNLNQNYEIIISDDASTDNSINFIKQEYPDIIILENKINGGFSKNINRGIQKANGKWVMLLNSDIKLSENYFNEIAKHLLKKDIFGVMGKILDEKSNLLEGLKYPKPSIFKINSVKDLDVNPIISNNYLTFYLSGANAIINRNKLNELEGFNELFSPFYHEDLDLSIRAWRLGWPSYYEPLSICYHNPSSTIKKNSSKSFIKTVSTRNRILLHYIHLNSVGFYLWFFNFVITLSLKFLIGKQFYFNALKLFFQHRNIYKDYRINYYKNKIFVEKNITDIKNKIINQKV